MTAKRWFVTVAALVTVLSLAAVPTARADCGVDGDTTEREAERLSFTRSDVVLQGVALRGPNASGALLSPARFRVTHYLKGSGPTIVRVQTATVRQGPNLEVTEDLIDPRPGETWRIYAQGSSRRVLRTSICDYSKRLRVRKAP